ncbi:MAG: hypothetical protein ABEH77_09895 [Halobacteriaceae archaeon]
MPQRRAFLRAAGTLAAGLAGCAAPTRGAAPWPWLVAPREVGADHYEFLSLRPRTLLHSDAVAREVRRSLRANVGVRVRDEFGVELAAVDGYTFYAADGGVSGGHGAVRGGIVADRVADAAAGNGYTAEGSYAGFDLYLSPAGALAIGIGDDLLVFGARTEELSAVAAARAVADAESGRLPRYRETNADFDALADEVGGGVLVAGRTREPTADGLVGEGIRWRLGGTRSTVTRALVFTDAAAAGEADLRGQTDPRLRSAGADTARRGRVGVVRASLPTEAVGLGLFAL